MEKNNTWIIIIMIMMIMMIIIITTITTIQIIINCRLYNNTKLWLVTYSRDQL